MIDFTDYKTASAYAQHINAGASARLSLRARECIALNPVSQAAWLHGWDTTDAAERLAGRGMPNAGRTLHRLEVEWANVAEQGPIRLDATGRVMGVVSP